MRKITAPAIPWRWASASSRSRHRRLGAGPAARDLPEGTGYFLPKGADVVMQVHYHRNGRVEKDRTQIGLYFAKKPVASRFQSVVVRGNFIVIPRTTITTQINGTRRTDRGRHALLGHAAHAHARPGDQGDDDAARRQAGDAHRHQGLGLQLAGDVLLQGADPGQGGHASSTSRPSTTTATRTRTTPSTRRSWSGSASRRPTRCASSSWAAHHLGPDPGRSVRPAAS